MLPLSSVGQAAPATTQDAQGEPAAPTAEAPSRAEINRPRRFPASSVPSITGIRISPGGGEATLLNISSGGLLAQCSERLQPGRSLTVLVEGTFSPRSIRGKVIRSSVASLGADGRLRYHVGIAFTTAITLDDAVVAGSAAPQATAEAPPTAPTAPTPAVIPLRNRW